MSQDIIAHNQWASQPVTFKAVASNELSPSSSFMGWPQPSPKPTFPSSSGSSLRSPYSPSAGTPHFSLAGGPRSSVGTPHSDRLFDGPHSGFPSGIPSVQNSDFDFDTPSPRTDVEHADIRSEFDFDTPSPRLTAAPNLEFDFDTPSPRSRVATPDPCSQHTPVDEFDFNTPSSPITLELDDFDFRTPSLPPLDDFDFTTPPPAADDAQGIFHSEDICLGPPRYQPAGVLLQGSLNVGPFNIGNSKMSPSACDPNDEFDFGKSPSLSPAGSGNLGEISYSCSTSANLPILGSPMLPLSVYPPSPVDLPLLRLPVGTFDDPGPSSLFDFGSPSPSLGATAVLNRHASHYSGGLPPSGPTELDLVVAHVLEQASHRSQSEPLLLSPQVHSYGYMAGINGTQRYGGITAAGIRTLHSYIDSHVSNQILLFVLGWTETFCHGTGPAFAYN